MAHKKHTALNGFTIVELLIVIVIIGILSTITVVAFSGVQKEARDSLRKSDISTITKALELYYSDNGRYPSGSGSTTINGHWSTTADGSWSNLESQLSEYTTKLPSDPTSTTNTAAMSGGYNYDYFSGAYCGAASNQMYIIVYRFEDSPQTNTFIGDCPSSPLGPYSGSNYRLTK